MSPPCRSAGQLLDALVVLERRRCDDPAVPASVRTLPAGYVRQASIIASPKGKARGHGVEPLGAAVGVELGALGRDRDRLEGGDPERRPTARPASDVVQERRVDAHARVVRLGAAERLVLHDERLVVGQRGRLGEAEVVDVRARCRRPTSAGSPGPVSQECLELVALGWTGCVHRDVRPAGPRRGSTCRAAGVCEQRRGAGRARPVDHHGGRWCRHRDEATLPATSAAVAWQPCRSRRPRPAARRCRPGRRRSTTTGWGSASGRRPPRGSTSGA